MTAHYDELSTKDVVFGQLRNCIDLAVVAALVAKERLNEKTGWDMLQRWPVRVFCAERLGGKQGDESILSAITQHGHPVSRVGAIGSDRGRLKRELPRNSVRRDRGDER